MADLDDILARFPDNSVGAIDADDLRYALTELWNKADANETQLNVEREELDEIQARLQAVEVAESAGATISVTGIWQVNPQAGAVPGGQQMTCDTGILDTATWLRLTPVDKSNTDETNALVACTTIYAQNQQDASRWVRYQVNSETIEAGYIQQNVTVIDSGGVPGSAGWQNAIFVLGGIPA